MHRTNLQGANKQINKKHEKVKNYTNDFFSRFNETFWLSKKHLLLPGKLLMFQTKQLPSGVYFTVPIEVLNFGESASLGTGIITSTLFAVERLLN